MFKTILLLLALGFPIYGWSCDTGTNYGDVSMTNLPEKILINAGSYSAGTILYDSGQITRSQTSVLNCQGNIYAQFAWSSGNIVSSVSDGIYSTNVPGIGLRVKVWLNITGEYNGDSDDFNADYSQHYIGDADMYLGKPTGFLDSGASNSALTLKDPVSSVSIRDDNKLMVISQLHVSGTTKIQLTPMGCTASTTALNFPMGSVNSNAFNLSAKAGFAQQTLTLSCEPGTNVTMRITATEAEGDNPDHTVIALTPGDNVATGVGVQLNINGAPLSVNNSTYRVFDAVNRTTVTNPGAEAGYTIFADPANTGGAAASNQLVFSTNYYKTGSEITPGTANASGTITFSYN